MITLLTFTLLAGWTKRLALNGIFGQIWALPCLVALYTIDTTTANKWVVFAITTILLAYPSNHSVQVGMSYCNRIGPKSRITRRSMLNQIDL